MIADTPEGAKNLTFASEMAKKKFVLWMNGFMGDEDNFENIFETKEFDDDEILITLIGEGIPDEEGEEEDTGTEQKSTYGIPDEEEDPWKVKEIELTLEPLGLTMKAAKDYRRGAGQIFKSRLVGAIPVFQRNLKKLLGAPRAVKQDLDQIRLTVQGAINRFIGTLSVTSERAFQLLVEDGMSSVGVNMLKQQLSPETVRALYYDSPIWTTYSKMSTELVRTTNDVITHHLIRTTDIDKYGKPHGLDRDKMISDLVDVAGLQEKRARTIARTESRVVRSKGREIGFKIKDPNGEWTYKWGGPYDRPRGYYKTDKNYRNAPSCRWVADQIPRQGVSLEKLKNLIKEATAMFHPKLKPRDWSCHPNEMHTPQKVVRRFDPELAIEESFHQEEGVDTHA